MRVVVVMAALSYQVLNSRSQRGGRRPFSFLLIATVAGVIHDLQSPVGRIDFAKSVRYDVCCVTKMTVLYRIVRIVAGSSSKSIELIFWFSPGRVSIPILENACAR